MTKKSVEEERLWDARSEEEARRFREELGLAEHGLGFARGGAWRLRIELQWAFSEADMQRGPCELCEVEFTPRAVVIRTDPHGYEACEECLRALSARKEQAPDAPGPTREEYQELVEAHPEPMFKSPEAMQASEDVGHPHWPAYDKSWLWRAPRS